MKEKLPKVFANKIEKNISNNEKVYSTNNIINKNDHNDNEKKEKSPIQKTNQLKKNKTKNINQKIDQILKSKEYIYKIPVKIEIEKELIHTNIIGKNNTNIITIDNNLIKIEDIKNIEIDEKNE